MLLRLIMRTVVSWLVGSVTKWPPKAPLQPQEPRARLSVSVV